MPHLAMFHPGDGEDAAHLRLHRVVRQPVVCRVEFPRGGRRPELDEHHVLVGTTVVDDAQVLEVPVAGRRELQQVRCLVLGRHPEDDHHLGVGKRGGGGRGRRRQLLVLGSGGTWRVLKSRDGTINFELNHCFFKSSTFLPIFKQIQNLFCENRSFW
jgi:hypothetical protein